jgi:Holliday junction resolvase RusA-like endonuclease
MRVSFFVTGKPEGYSRSAAKLGFTPPNVTAWRKAIAVEYMGAVSNKPDMSGYAGPVALFLEAFGTSADSDNVAKEAQDALKGLAFLDDSQVVELRIGFPDRKLSPKGKPRKESGKQGLGVVIHFLEVQA